MAPCEGALGGGVSGCSCWGPAPRGTWARPPPGPPPSPAGGGAALALT